VAAIILSATMSTVKPDNKHWGGTTLVIDVGDAVGERDELFALE
jgi:hypothetical protein